MGASLETQISDMSIQSFTAEQRTDTHYLKKHPEQLESEIWKNAMIERSMATALDALQNNQPVLLTLYDDTLRGGKHTVYAFFDPLKPKIVLEMPPEGGQTPTMLHGLEIIVRLLKDTGAQNAAIRELEIKHMQRSEIVQLRNQTVQDHRALVPLVIPLNVHPDGVVAINFHSQDRKVNMRQVVGRYLEFLTSPDAMNVFANGIFHLILGYDGRVGVKNEYKTYEIGNYAELEKRYNHLDAHRLKTDL